MSAPVEPSHRQLFASLGMRFMMEYGDRHGAETEERDALYKELLDEWRNLGFDLEKVEVSDEEILARRHALMPKQVRLNALTAALASSWDTEYGAFLKRNPAPKGWGE